MPGGSKKFVQSYDEKSTGTDKFAKLNRDAASNPYANALHVEASLKAGEAKNISHQLGVPADFNLCGAYGATVITNKTSELSSAEKKLYIRLEADADVDVCMVVRPK